MSEEKRAELVNITIDGIPAQVPPGTNLIEAAKTVGIEIPHYCYHPGLSIAANCRMCLVETNKHPPGKLVPGCQITVMEGMEIKTQSQRVKDQQRSVQELLLLHHPVDCAICDQAGECRLQDYYQEYDYKPSRLDGPKWMKNKRKILGPTIVLDQERCIMCTRCVRFMREIAKDDLLGVVQRGHRSVIDTFFEQGLDDSPFHTNIVDICPVGALLDKDFLHKARVWDLDHTPSICPNCSQGCNIRIDTRDNLVQRLRPRANPDVNSYWMCDYGRHSYEWMNGTDRIEAPLVRDGDRLVAQNWQPAMLALLERLKERSGTVRVVGSPMLSNEDNGLLARLAQLLGAASQVYRSARAADEVVLPGFPKLARRRELAANGRGLEALGFQRVGDDQAKGGLTSADVLIVLGDELADMPADFGSDASLFVYLGHRLHPAARNAHFVLPVSTFAEQEGTFTNFEGRVQRFWPALQAPPLARPAWQVLGVLLAGLDDGPAPADAANAFLRVGSFFEPFAGLTYEMIGTRGALMNEPVAIGAGGGD